MKTASQKANEWLTANVKVGTLVENGVICKVNKTSVWIKTNTGKIIKEVYAGQVKNIIKKEQPVKKQKITGWMVIDIKKRERFDFNDEKQAEKKFNKIVKNGGYAEIANVWG